MKTKKKTVKVQYEFEIEYEHKDHLKHILNDLEKEPINSRCGAGVASDQKVYSYSCKRIGNGKIIK